MAEIFKIREITIDTMQHKGFNVKEEELKLIRFYQNDLNTAKLLINVTHDKVVTDFSAATSVQIAFLKPDCKRVFQDVQNVNQMQGKYYVVLSTQTLIAYGNVIAQLRFTFPNNKVIETCKFAFTVDESIMSDEAMKSTNEFPVIQKAIEAGKKLEGVDINGIIAAGAKADAALPKTGGTMTGNLKMTKVSSASARYVEWQIDGTPNFRVGQNSSNNFVFYDVINNAIPLEYKLDTRKLQVNSSTVGGFDVNCDTNLLKKTDIYSAAWKPDGYGNNIHGGDLNAVNGTGFYFGNNLINSPDGSTAYFSVQVQRVANASSFIQFAFRWSGPQVYYRTKVNTGDWSSWKELADKDKSVQKTGDTVTGALFMKGSNAIVDSDSSGIIQGGGSTAKRWRMYQSGNGELSFVPSATNGGNDWEWNKAFRIKPDGSVSTPKDSTIDLVITSDFTPTSGTVQNIVRRGNTVTLMLDVTRNADSTNPIVTTLPEGVRPIGSLTTDIASTDGTMSRLLVRFNGEIHLDTKGKRYRILQTFVTP
ncbi:BppU family phage baseplate upper protein [Bacillus tropicus]